MNGTFRENVKNNVKVDIFYSKWLFHINFQSKHQCMLQTAHPAEIFLFQYLVRLRFQSWKPIVRINCYIVGVLQTRQYVNGLPLFILSFDCRRFYVIFYVMRLSLSVSLSSSEKRGKKGRGSITQHLTVIPPRCFIFLSVTMR